MTPIFRVVYHTGESLIAKSRIACRKHVAAKSNEIVEQVIDQTENDNLFCDDCVADPPRPSSSSLISGTCPVCRKTSKARR